MPDFLQIPIVFTTLATLLSLFVGSFLNVVIHRLPKMMEQEWLVQAAELRGEPAPQAARFNLAAPRSRCPHCGTPISAIDNVPIVSYTLLRGRCRHCSAPIGVRYPVVEGITALLSGLAAWRFGPGIAAIGAILFIWAMIALTFIDVDTQLLPDSLTLPLVWLGLIFNLGGTFASLSSAVIGAVAGYLVLWSVYWAFKLTTGKEGMGYGDFKLLAAIGAWLGWKILPMTILLSSAVGALVGIALILFARHGRNVPIPFGPYLAAAGVLALFFGNTLTERYLALL